MSTLLCSELVTELVHEVRLTTSRRIHLAAICPYLLMFNSPAGTFTLSMYLGATLIFSKDFTSADIKTSLSTTDNYAHVFYPVIPDYLVQLSSGVYTVKLTASGYTMSESSYLGWIQQYLNNQNETEYTVEHDYQYPLAMRIKIYQEGNI